MRGKIIVNRIFNPLPMADSVLVWSAVLNMCGIVLQVMALMAMFVTGIFTEAVAGEVAMQQCVRLNRVDMDVRGTMGKMQKRQLLRPYMGKCIDGKLLKAI